MLRTLVLLQNTIINVSGNCLTIQQLQKKQIKIVIITIVYTQK